MIDLSQIEELNPHQFKYKGVDVNQRYGVWNFLDSICEQLEELPVVIIELGTMHGGWSTVLSEHEISDNAVVHTFDILDRDLTEFFQDNNKVEFHCLDMFKNEQVIIDLIQKADGPVMLFCDGGDKKKEFNTFAPFLRSGDMIFGHDYIRDRPLFKEHFNSKKWNWHELQMSHIQETVAKQKLEPFLEEIAQEYVWASFKKK